MGSLPPVEPPDLRRNRRRTEANEDPLTGNYPPPDSNYPSQGSTNYPPPGSPRFRPQPAAAQPPWPPPEENYPPPGSSNYPPAPQNYPSPGANYPPPDAERITLDDPRYGRSQAPPPPETYPPPAYNDDPLDLDDQRYGSPRGRSAYRDDYASPSPALDRVAASDLRRERSVREAPPRSVKPARRRAGASGGLLTERQVESLAWGSVVVLLGISLILAVTGTSGFIKVVFPLMAGVILMLSSIYQSVVMHWHVGPLTWLIAGLLLSYTITLLIAGDDTGILKWIVYFTGTLVIMLGITVVLRVFQGPRY